MKITAYSRHSLLQRLSTIDTSVSLQGKGRTTEETERWSICRLVSTLAWERKLRFPFKCEKSERPDFVLSINGHPHIGVEVSEVVNEDLVRTEVLPEAADSDSIVDSSLFRWRDGKRKVKELRKIASETSLTGPGWVGYEPETEFADAITDRIAVKTRKLNEDDYARFNENWLLLYENLALPALKRSLAISYLSLSLANYWKDDKFSRVFVETDRYIAEISATRVSMYDVWDLW